VLDERVEELAARYDKGWRGIFEHMRDERRGASLLTDRYAFAPR